MKDEDKLTANEPVQILELLWKESGMDIEESSIERRILLPALGAYD